MHTERLTDTIAESYLSLVPFLSPKGLAKLIDLESFSPPEPEPIGLLSLLRGDLLDLYDWSRQCHDLPRRDLLELFLQCGDATEAAEDLGMSDRTARSWVEDFCRFLSRLCEHYKAIDWRRVQCEESCDRKAQHSPSFGAGKWTATERTKREPRFDLGGQCAGCPVRAGS